MQTEEIMWSFCDLFAKLLLEAALFQGTMCTLEERKLITLNLLSEQYHAEKYQQLEQSSKQQDRFFAAVSHELRTPLNGIIGLSDSLLLSMSNGANADPARSAKILKTIRDSGRRLSTLVNNILDSTSLKESTLVIKYEPVGLIQVIEEVVELTQPILRRGVRIAVNVPQDVPIIEGDSGRIMQVLHNLLGNASKFTSEGSITVSVDVFEEEPASGGGQSSKGQSEGEPAMMVAVLVTDTGIGIPKENLDTIFNPFEQVDMSTTRKYGGTVASVWGWSSSSSRLTTAGLAPTPK
jgi:signal transduction histidine kinase